MLLLQSVQFSSRCSNVFFIKNVLYKFFICWLVKTHQNDEVRFHRSAFKKDDGLWLHDVENLHDVCYAQAHMSRILKWDPKRTDREEVGVQVVLGSRISSLLRNYYANDPKYPWRPFLYSEVALLLMLGEIQATTITSEIVRHLTHLLTLHTSSIRIWKKKLTLYIW